MARLLLDANMVKNFLDPRSGRRALAGTSPSAERCQAWQRQEGPETDRRDGKPSGVFAPRGAAPLRSISVPKAGDEFWTSLPLMICEQQKPLPRTRAHQSQAKVDRHGRDLRQRRATRRASANNQLVVTMGADFSAASPSRSRPCRDSTWSRMTKHGRSLMEGALHCFE